MTVPTEPVMHAGKGRVSRAERFGLVSPIAEETDGRNDAEQLADKLDAALKQFGYEIHPKAQETPSLTMEEYLSLRQKIGESGMLNPILVHKDTLVDGRHRLMAAYDLQMPPNVKQLHDAADLEAVIYNSEARRHQTKSQMAAFTVLFYEDKVRELTAAGNKQKAAANREIVATTISGPTFVSQTAAVGNQMANYAVALLNAGRTDLLVDVRDGKISSMEKAYQQHLDESKGAEDEPTRYEQLVDAIGRVENLAASAKRLADEIDGLRAFAERSPELDALIEGLTDIADLVGDADEVLEGLKSR